MKDAPELDVLIVGAGPTGLTLAIELAAQGISYRIIDKAPRRSDKSRALVVHPRTQELLSRHGDVRELVDRARILKGANLYVSPTKSPRLDFEGLDIPGTEFPRPLSISQVETEFFLESLLGKTAATQAQAGATSPVGVEWLMAAESFVQDEQGVTVTLSKGGHPRPSEDDEGKDGSGQAAGEINSSETIRCKYVVGCDGAHSVVRHAATAVQFPGEAYPDDFVLCDAHIANSPLPRDRLGVVLGSSVVAVIPLGGDMIRMAAVRLGVHVRDELPPLSEFQGLLEEVVLPALPAGRVSGSEPPRLFDPVWMTRFRLHSRCVTSYRDGRLFIAGDAAHIHSPLGGQGMNTSIQDAVNLGWKLAAVLRGERPATLLDTYNEERRPVGQALIRSTDTMFRVASIKNRLLVWLRDLLVTWIITLAVANKSRRLEIFKRVCEFTTNYRGSSIVATARGFSGPVRGGDRLSDGKLLALPAEGTNGGATLTLQQICGGTRHSLLLFAGVGSHAATVEHLAQAASKAAAARQDILISTIVTTAEHVPKAALFDQNGALHSRYGFQKPGYVLARPDGYVAHIGHLSSFDELLAYLNV